MDRTGSRTKILIDQLDRTETESSSSSEDLESSSGEDEQRLIPTAQPANTASKGTTSSATNSQEKPPRLSSRSAGKPASSASGWANKTNRNGNENQAMPGTGSSLVAYAPSSVRREMSPEERSQAANQHQALISAAENGLIHNIDKLIEQRVDLNKPDLDGYTALHHAAQNGHILVVDTLIASGANPLAVTPSAYTPLALAASHGHAAVVECLFYHCYAIPSPAAKPATLGKPAQAALTSARPAASSSTTGRSDSTRSRIYSYEQSASVYEGLGEAEQDERLFAAVKDNNLAGAARMIAARARRRTADTTPRNCMHLEDGDEKGRSLLIQACINGNTEMATLLLCAGASIDSADTAGMTALMHAVKAKHARVVAALLNAHARVDAADSIGHTALSLAIDSGDIKVLNAMRSGNVDIWHNTAWGEALIIYAALNNKEPIVKALLALKADMPDARGSKSIAIFAQRGNDKAVSLMLRAGADPHHKAADGHTAFTLAAANGHEKVTAILLKHHARVEWKRQLQAQTDSQGRTALMLAVLNGKYDMVAYLLKNEADPHQPDHGGRTALLWAAARSDARMLGILIQYGATHVHIDNHGNNMYIVAAAHNNLDLLRAICTPYYRNSQFDINTPNKDGDSALIEAARHGFEDMVQLLLNNGANVLHSNAAGRTALLEATKEGHRAVMNRLQTKEASLPPVYPYANIALQALSVVPLVSRLLPARVPVRTRTSDKEGNSAMLLAAENGRDRLLNDLFRTDTTSGSERYLAHSEAGPGEFVAGASSTALHVGPVVKINIEEKNIEGLNALCMATRGGHFNTIKLLLDKGAKAYGSLPIPGQDVNYGITPLWLAARLATCEPGTGNAAYGSVISHSPEMVVDLLLKHGARADINTLSGPGQSPLIAAAGAGRVGVVNLLIDAGAQVDQVDVHKLTPLMHACHYGHLEVALRLLNKGASPDPRPGKLSALTLAAEGGHDRIVSLLAARGTDINHADKTGNTALIGAAKGAKTSTVKLLMQMGANLQHRDDRGNSALEYTLRAGHHETYKLLEQGSPPPRDH